jgi:hypothetical protein
MTQTSSAIIAINPSMEICQTVHEYALSNARLPASPRDRKRVARGPFTGDIGIGEGLGPGYVVVGAGVSGLCQDNGGNCADIAHLR